MFITATEMSYDSKFNDQTNASPSVEEYFEFGTKAQLNLSLCVKTCLFFINIPKACLIDNFFAFEISFVKLVSLSKHVFFSSKSKRPVLQRNLHMSITAESIS